MRWILTAFALVSLQAFAADATLEIVAGEERLSFTTSQLLARQDLKTVNVTDSEYRLHVTRFKAIALADLFKGLTIPEFAAIQCNATDGFSANLDKRRLLSADPKASKPFLAIEDPAHPWPLLPGKANSAGPFYLVWTNPRASDIGPEEWPYQIASFHVLTDPASVFPKIYPAADAPPAVQNGLRSFQKNCFACHAMNGNGAGTIGPDLNLPMNPTDYFEPAALRALIRNPATVRTWPRREMRGYSAAEISDAELADLLAYLQYMSTHRSHP
jgi:mono/diheme cytochrome c family protein